MYLFLFGPAQGLVLFDIMLLGSEPVIDHNDQILGFEYFLYINFVFGTEELVSRLSAVVDILRQ